jgi:hypothetical protein
MKKDELAPPPPARPWTRIDDYVVALARERSARRQRAPRPRTEPEAPRLMLSTIPFLILIMALGVITAAIAVAAWPGQRYARSEPRAAAQQGTAAAGWIERAGREPSAPAR